MQWPKEKGQQIIYKALHRKLNNTITTMTVPFAKYIDNGG
jgi:hypothetical protein